MFELYSMILVLNLAHYPGWSVTLAGSDSLLPIGWHLSITDILLQETFLMNVSNLLYTIFMCIILVTLSTTLSIHRLQEVACPLATSMRPCIHVHSI